jgi:hypothetical protein
MTQPISLGAIDEAVMRSYLVRRSASAGKTMTSGTAQLIIDRAGPVPNDIQSLAYETFAEVTGKTITNDDVQRAMQAAIGFQNATYATIWGDRSGLQQRVLAAIADRPESAPYSKEFGRVTGGSPSSLQRAVEALDEAELIVERNGTWWVSDPFFAGWIR